jgi:hypothetical protein
MKKHREAHVRRRARELAEAGRFSGSLGIESELRFVEDFQEARVWLDSKPIREELDILCRQARSRKSAPTSKKVK